MKPTKRDAPIKKIGEYRDELHAESMEGIAVDENGYKYRLLNGVMMPPYVTPHRFQVSRCIRLRDGDVSFCSFPKSGSTWLSKVIYLILHGGHMPEDQTLRSSIHWMESSWPYPRELEEVDALESPRIFKSHMPYDMALGGDPINQLGKHIYIARNPKDVCVSYYHFETGKAWSGDYNPSWETWLKLFLEGRVQRGCWFDHVLGWWNHRKADNLLFMKYEDMNRDAEGQVRSLASFLDYRLSDQIITDIVEATTFSRMKSDEFSSLSEIAQLDSFYRKGETGSWKNQFTVAQSEAFDALYARRMRGTGLHFDFE